MVRLGALKHHAKVLRHRETKQQEAERLRAAAHAKALERARRKKALEKAAILHAEARVEDLVAKNKLEPIPSHHEDTKVVVKYCPVQGFETVHKKLKTTKLKPVVRRSDGPQPHERQGREDGVAPPVDGAAALDLGLHDEVRGRRLRRGHDDGERERVRPAGGDDEAARHRRFCFGPRRASCRQHRSARTQSAVSSADAVCVEIVRCRAPMGVSGLRARCF